MKNDRPRNKLGQFISLQENHSGSPEENEVAMISSLLGGLGIESYNPDLLVQKKGSLDVYRKMVADPHVKAALQQKKSALLAVPFDILPGGDTDADREIADFVKWNLTEFLVDSFEADLLDFLFALDDGFSISEKIWSEVKQGRFKGNWAYKQFKSKDPKSYKFKLDNFGNILPMGLINEDSREGRQELPIDKFFHYAYQKRYENPFGESDLRSAYRAFWIKDVAWKLRSIFMERYAGNFLKGKYKKGDKAGQAKLLEIFQSWGQQSGVAMPEGIDIEVLQLAVSGENEYKSAIADASKEIIIGILGATLTVDEGRKTGARALGEVHKQVADLFVLFLDITLSSEINKQLIRSLVDFNYFGVVNYPKFVFDSRTQITTADIKTLKDSGISIPEDWLYRKLKIPKPSNQKTALKQLTKDVIESGSVSRNEIRERDGLDPMTGPYYTDPASLVIQPQSPAILSEPRGPVKKFQQVHPEDLGKNLPNKSDLEPGQFWREPNKFEQFAEIEVVDLTTRSTEEAAIKGSQPAYDEIQDGIIKQVEKKGILRRPQAQRAKAIEDAAKVVANVSSLRDQLFNSILVNDVMGRNQLITEMDNQVPEMKFREKLKFAESLINVEILEEPTPPKEVAKIMARRAPMTRKEFHALVDVKQSEAFYVAGLEKKNIEKDVQPLLVQAINEGWDTRDFEFALDQTFVKYKEPTFNQVGKEGEKILDFHTQTVFRNAMMSSYNMGREQMRMDPDVIEVFPANIISAIMDNRITKEICFRLDSLVFLATDPRWDKYKPLNHHKCRTILITINKFDFTPDMLSSLPNIQIPVGFGG